MSNAILPTLAGVQWGITKRPIWNSRVQTSVGGYETRIALASLPRWRWSLSFEFLRQNTTDAEFQSLANFFNARQGKYDSFLYSDPSDNTISDSVSLRQNFGTGDGATSGFQLGRSLVASGVFEYIYNLNATPKIYKNAVLQVAGVDYNISNGLVAFTAPPAGGAALTWSGTYYWRARFDQDGSDFTEFMDAYWSLAELAFVSILGS